MRIVNAAIPRRDRAVVQMHLDQLNKILPNPDVTQLDVIVGGAGYSLKDAAEDRVEAKLAEDQQGGLSGIIVTTEEGTVTLTGTVQKAERKARAAELARQVKGVRRVKNDLDIRADPAP